MRHIYLLAVLASCASAVPVKAPRDLGPLPTLDALPLREDPQGLQRAALGHYANGDYVRALKYAYWAAQSVPTDVRLRLLLGMVYDVGFERPDLAIPEYQRARDLSSSTELSAALDDRLRHLTRRHLQERYLASLLGSGRRPMTRNSLAAFPFTPTGPKQPEEGVAHGLITMLLPALRDRSKSLHVDPFVAPIVANVFIEVRGHKPAEFAKWSGAGAVLTGSLTDLGKRRVRCTLHVLSPSGAVVWASQPVEESLDEVGRLYQRLLIVAGEGLGIPVSQAPPSILNAPVAFSLYAEGLAHYGSARVAEARHSLGTALALEPESPVLQAAFRWVDQDLRGHNGQRLAGAYDRLLRLPDPSAVLKRRVASAHGMVLPRSPLITGRESDSPYKAPRPEVAP